MIFLLLAMVILALIAGVLAYLRGFQSGMSGRYPTVLSSSSTRDPDFVPVVTYHEVTAERLRDELDFLVRNGYETIDASTLVAWLSGEEPAMPRRPVLLTFDDGRRSLWSTAYPVLREYELRAMAFICPYFIGDEVVERTEDDRARYFARFVTWPQLREMEASGVMDVQSHSYEHHRVLVDGRILGFVGADALPRLIRWADHALAGFPRPPLGTPILPSEPRFGYRRRFHPDPERVRACQEYVAAHGGEEFFRRPEWRGELLRAAGLTGDELVLPGRYETLQEQRDAMVEDLAKAKKVLQERLDKPVEHLALPWDQGCTLAAVAAAEVGYRAIYMGYVENADLCRLGCDCLAIPRFNAGENHNRYVKCLPGRGRRSVGRILLSSALARLWGGRDG